MNDSDVCEIKVDINNQQNKYAFDDFFEYSHHVVLQTTDSSLISEIYKMQIINNMIYILDKMEVILVFDMEGHFIKSIYHKGPSGMEYIKATDFEADADGNVYICDFHGGKILKYSGNDEFITAIKLPVKASSFKIMGENRFAINLCNGSTAAGEQTFFNYLYYDDNRIVHKAIPFNSHLQGYTFSYGYGLSSFYTYSGKVFMTSSMNDTVFTVDSAGIPAPFVAYDFGMKKPELSFSKEEIEQYLREQQKEERVSSIYCFYLFNDYLFISFNYQSKTGYVISKGDEAPVFTGSFGFDRNGLCILPVVYLSDAKTPQLVTLVNPDYLAGLLKRRKPDDNSGLLLSLQKSVVEGDNPVLVFYDWKYLQ